MKVRISYLLIITALIVNSCNKPRYNFDKGIIPLEVTNFEAVNSGYDDYNSDIVISWANDHFSLAFSTNRYSNGAQYDLVYYDCHIQSILVNGIFSVFVNEGQIPLIDTVNSNANEFGPYFSFDKQRHTYPIPDNILNDEHRLFYTSDLDGKLDLRYIYYRIDNYMFEVVDSSRELSSLNSDSDDGYLCMHDSAIINKESIYFTSNRDGQFDIYHAVGETSMKIEKSEMLDISKSIILSSGGDDKCPYIKNNMMVFTSNRPGGFGGYDLYYSLFNGDSWSVPVNFGEDINSEYDEYRPIIFDTYDQAFLNDLLIFSSNRPGGMGGFDLYYAGMKPAAYYLGE